MSQNVVLNVVNLRKEYDLRPKLVWDGFWGGG